MGVHCSRAELSAVIFITREDKGSVCVWGGENPIKDFMYSKTENTFLLITKKSEDRV